MYHIMSVCSALHQAQMQRIISYKVAYVMAILADQYINTYHDETDY